MVKKKCELESQFTSPEVRGRSINKSPAGWRQPLAGNIILLNSVDAAAPDCKPIHSQQIVEAYVEAQRKGTIKKLCEANLQRGIATGEDIERLTFVLLFKFGLVLEMPYYFLVD
jgi:hypothetical protein